MIYALPAQEYLISISLFRDKITLVGFKSPKSGFNTSPSDRDYSRFQSVLLVKQITIIGNDMCFRR